MNYELLKYFCHGIFFCSEDNFLQKAFPYKELAIIHNLYFILKLILSLYCEVS